MIILICNNVNVLCAKIMSFHVLFPFLYQLAVMVSEKKNVII